MKGKGTNLVTWIWMEVCKPKKQPVQLHYFVMLLLKSRTFCWHHFNRTSMNYNSSKIRKIKDYNSNLEYKHFITSFSAAFILFWHHYLLSLSPCQGWKHILVSFYREDKDGLLTNQTPIKTFQSLTTAVRHGREKSCWFDFSTKRHTS